MKKMQIIKLQAALLITGVRIRRVVYTFCLK